MLSEKQNSGSRTTAGAPLSLPGVINEGKHQSLYIEITKVRKLGTNLLGKAQSDGNWEFISKTQNDAIS